MAGCLKCNSCHPIVLACLLGWVGYASAQGGRSLPDPTRPPAATNGDPASASADVAAAPSGLQTIILGKGHKPMAVINGVIMELGDKLGDATLVKLTETEAVLQGPSGREVLNLLPGLVKRSGAEGYRIMKDDGMKHDK